MRPIFADGRIISDSQSNGHWSDVGGSVPGSFDVRPTDMSRKKLRITPVRLWNKGRFCRDVAHLFASNTRDSASIIGDMQSQSEATRVAEREILRLVGKYGRNTVQAGFAGVQDYVEHVLRQRLSALPEQAIACVFNNEYLLTGGRDLRRPDKPTFMFYDWLPGGWGGRNGKDGCGVHDLLVWMRHDVLAGRGAGAHLPDADH